MKKDDVFPSKYLKAADLGGKPVAVSIEQARLETLKTADGKEQQKVVLYFVGSKKSLPLNVTNFDAVVDASGEDDSERWAGHKVELYPTKTQMGGKTVDCIRIRPPAQPQLRMAAKAPPPPPVSEAEPPPVDDMADEIPWLQ